MKKLISWLKIRTTNEWDKSQIDIWNAWWDFFEKGYNDELLKYSLSDKVYVVYTNYSWDFLSWEYDFYLWFEVQKNLEKFSNIEIFMENYKVFEFDYNQPEDTIKAWEKIWSYDLDRAYSFDLEEYDYENSKLKIYISLN